MKHQQLSKEFENHFHNLSMKHSAWSVWEHFLDCAINSFCMNYNTRQMDHIREKYSQEERHILGKMIMLWIQIMNERIVEDNDWYDFFGSFYENMSMTKEKGFAQFFTPAEVCTLMANITYSDISNDEFKTVSDPSCGSGRNHLAYHVMHQNAFHVGVDLDIVCVKMCTLNFMMHGINGIVECQNTLTLSQDSWRGAFITNHDIAPSIIYVDDYQTAKHYIYSMTTTKYQQYLDALQDLTPIQEVKPSIELDSPYGASATSYTQLSLF